MPQDPGFSIIIPTHCRPRLLERALESVRQQGVDGEVEVIVVSDAVDPATDAVATKWLTGRDAYVRRNGKPGPSASRNLGMRLAAGRHLLFLDDDDALSPGFLGQALAHPAVQAGRGVYVDGVAVDESRLPTGPVIHSESALALQGALTEQVFVKNQVPFSCFLFPRARVQALSFDEHMRAYEDWEFVLNFLSREWPEHLPLTGPRIHVVRDDTTDRRGSSAAAKDFRAVMDYLHVYHRYPVKDPGLRERRWQMMQLFGIPLPPDVY